MIIPTEESMDTVIQSILDKDYTDSPNAPVEGNLEYPEEIQDTLPIEKTNNILKSNYVEPTRSLQKAYESQFRSFSSKKDKDSFEELI